MDCKELVEKMTLEEKCSLLSGGGQFTTKSVKRLGIPAMYLSDGPSGLRKQAGAADHLGLNPSVPATCYPSAATLANSWNPELEERVGAYMGAEVKAARVNVLLAPGLNIKRNPLCGRNFEYFSEDPYLAGKMAAACVRGLQSNGISACPKHFAVNSQETLRMHSDSVIDERTLREIYLTAFEIAVKEGKPKCLMSSYNRVNGVYGSEHGELLQKILREEWGFEGFTVTDWGGSNDRVAGVKAGTHLEMPTTGGDSDRELVRAVKNGELSEELLNLRVQEYINVLFDTTIAENSPKNFDEQAHHDFARSAAAECIVLLKNEDNILPLQQNTRVAVIGDFAQTPRFQGAGSSSVNATQSDVPLEFLKASGLNIVGYATGFERQGGSNEALLRQAVEMAKNAEIALLYLGLDELAESEGVDRQDMCLRANQVELLSAVAAVNPNTVVVLNGGSPIEAPWLKHCKGVLHGYLGGQAAAGAMADALVGKINPSGHLAETWAMCYSDVPTCDKYPAPEKTAEYRESLYVGYRYYDTSGVPVRFPFGFGLSYTTFAYSNLTVSDKEVCFTLTNTGDCDGGEVAQVYVSCPTGKVFRPAKELKGFQKVFLKAGESRQVTIPLDDKAFRYFNVKTGKWEIEGGTYVISVAANVNDVKLVGKIEVAGTNAPEPYFNLPHYESGNVRNVPDEEFSALLGRAIPESKWDRTKPLEMNDTFAQLQYAKGWVGRLVYKVTKYQVDKGMKAGKPDLDALFRYNMPIRAIAKMMGGMISMEMAEALLEIFNGHFFKGVGHFIGGFFRNRKLSKEFEKKLEEAGN